MEARNHEQEGLDLIAHIMDIIELLRSEHFSYVRFLFGGEYDILCCLNCKHIALSLVISNS